MKASNFTKPPMYGMDQLSGSGGGGLVPRVVDTTIGKAFRCEVKSGSDNRYSRPIFNDDKGLWQSSGQVTIGAKFRLGVGYASKVNAEQDLLRLDNYVHTTGPQEHVALCFRKDGTPCVATQFNGAWKPVIEGFKLPEGRWFGVVLGITLDQSDGEISLTIDTHKDFVASGIQTAPPISRYFTRIRFGVVSCPPTEHDARVVHVSSLTAI
jgi:hypothetical protein